MTAVTTEPGAVAAPRLRRALRATPLKPVSLVGVVVLWQLVSWLNERADWYNGALVPSPGRIGAAAVRLAASGELWTDVWSSTGRVLGGLAVAIPVAVVAALLTTGSRIADVVLDPVLEALRPVPTLALLPIFILWFGIGEASKIALIAFSTFFLVYVSAVEAVRHVDPVLVRAAGSLGLTRRQVYAHVVLRSIASRCSSASAWPRRPAGSSSWGPSSSPRTRAWATRARLRCTPIG